MDTNQLKCANCEQELKQGYAFCPTCGQKAKDDLTLGVLFYNTISNYFSFDARFFKSFIPMMLKPGYVARRFVEGKRMQYLHPAQYYLVASVLFFFIFGFSAREHTQAFDKVVQQGFENQMTTDTLQNNKVLDSATAAKITAPLKDPNIKTGMTEREIEELDSIIRNADKSDAAQLTFDYDSKKVDSLIQAGAADKEIYTAMGMDEDAGFFTKRFYGQLLKFQKNRGGGILQAFYDSIPIAMFFLLPLFALILKLFYWRRGRFSHHLVFAFYFFSFLFIVMSLIFGINIFWDIPDGIDWLVALSTFIYLWLALRRFYKQGIIISFIKGGIVTFIYMMFVVPLAFIVMLFGSFLMY